MNVDLGYVFSYKDMRWHREDTSHSIYAELKEDFDWFVDLNEHRALVLTGAMLVESALDDLLGEIVPGYCELSCENGFTFHLKILLAKGLRLWAPKAYVAAAAIRKIRNDFAHELKYRTLEDLPPTKLQGLHDRMEEFRQGEDRERSQHPTTNKDLFIGVATGTLVALRTQRHEASLLNRFLRSGKVAETLQRFHEETKDADPPLTGQ